MKEPPYPLLRALSERGGIFTTMQLGILSMFFTPSLKKAKYCVFFGVHDGCYLEGILSVWLRLDNWS